MKLSDHLSLLTLFPWQHKLLRTLEGLTLKALWSLGPVFILCAAAPIAKAAEPQSTSNPQPVATSATRSAPPAAPVRPVVDDYFGTKVTDPYRYMENLSEPEVQAWMKGQDSFTRATLDEISGHKQLLARIRELDL